MMKQFRYTVKDPMGMHARPVCMLVGLYRTFPDTIVTITKGDNTVKANQLLELMNLDIRSGETVTVTAENGDESVAIESLKSIFEKNL